MEKRCEICDGAVNRTPLNGGWDQFNCENCGRYTADMLSLGHYKEKDPHVETKLRYWLSRHTGSEVPELGDETVKRILEKPLPEPKELADNVVRFLATKSALPGDEVPVEIECKFQLGAGTITALCFACNHVIDSKWASGPEYQCSGVGATLSETGPLFSLTLTMKGWEYYDELKRGHEDSRKAFMAMQFGDNELNRIFEKTLKPAMEQVGFKLFNLADRNRLKAGLIDDRMRVEIQSSAIVLADLTHQNAGAYWEAGYAEGLGKPVIYTCSKKVFDREKTHFDTNHHLTIVWDPEKNDEAMEDLKATVRATLPDLASGVDLSTGEPS